MAVTAIRTRAPWLLLVFRLPAKHASRRVEIWRKLQRLGCVPLKNSGYLLPNAAAMRESFEWLAASIRQAGGDASIVEVQSVDGMPREALAERFRDARADDYRKLIREIQACTRRDGGAGIHTRLGRLRQRFEELAAIDFFGHPLRERARTLLEKTAAPGADVPTPRRDPREYSKRVWITRPRPGIDRCASAWLIRRFVDSEARFTFGTSPGKALPFDMYNVEFGHHGDECTFETLRKSFRVRDAKVAAIAEMVHDADLRDDKFGRREAVVIDQVLRGWAATGISDQELLARGMQVIDGLYYSLP